MRISDWSSDVCSSDLVPPGLCVVSSCTRGDRAPPRPPFAVSSACHAHPDDRPPAVARRADAEHDLDAVYRTDRTALFHLLPHTAAPAEAPPLVHAVFLPPAGHEQPTQPPHNEQTQ